VPTGPWLSLTDELGGGFWTVMLTVSILVAPLALVVVRVMLKEPIGRVTTGFWPVASGRAPGRFQA
jgi:hypothetical protein